MNTILIVDDIKDNLMVLMNTLEPLGAKVLIAKDGAQALSIAASAKPDIILLDVMMPEMDGFEVCSKLKADEELKQIPILFISALNQVEDIVRGFNLGAQDYISKPFQAKEVISRVKTQLEIKELTQALKLKNEQLQSELDIARHLNIAEDLKSAGPLKGSSIQLQVLKDNILKESLIDTPTFLISKDKGGVVTAVTREIHKQSKRSSRTSITVNCRQFLGSDRSLLSSNEFDLAKGSTLLLENIDCLSATNQIDLNNNLNFLMYENNIKIIIHSNSDLSLEVKTKRFNLELFEKVKKNKIYIPALSERLDDVISIADHYIARYSKEFSKPAKSLSERSKSVLINYNWPGGYSELRTLIEKEIALSNSEFIEISEDQLFDKQVYGGYLFKDLIGEGGMGEVWLAEHNLLARPAAVKIVKNAPVGEQEVLFKRFQREARAISSLTSPHTVTLFDYGISEEGEFYYVMEYLEGKDLGEILNEYGPLEPRRAIYFFKQACKSLAEAHNLNMIHRDIKPENLFVSKAGVELDFLKVLDFGIVSDHEEGDTSLTEDRLVGTPSYISPEMVSGSNIDTRSDLYSLACTFYRLLSGSIPFNKTNSMKLLMSHVNDVPIDIDEVTGGALPKTLSSLIMQCLKKNPDDRPQSASEILEILESIDIEAWDQESAGKWWDLYSRCELEKTE